MTSVTALKVDYYSNIVLGGIKRLALKTAKVLAVTAAVCLTAYVASVLIVGTVLHSVGMLDVRVFSVFDFG